jgi:hypothetical protein
MTCETCQRRLLASEYPSAPSAEVRAHLQTCPACSSWHGKLLRVERHVPLLPVPLTHARKRFLAQFLGTAEPGPEFAAPSEAPPPPVCSAPWWRKPHFLRATAAAAAVVLVVCGVLLGLMMKGGPAPQGPVAADREPDQDLVALLADCDVRLAEADTPGKRVAALADLSEALRREGQALRGAEGAEKDLREVAQLYERVIRKGVVPGARRLPPAERRAALDPIAGRLARASREAQELARGARSGPAAEPLRQIAAAADAGDRELRRLMEGVQ